MTKRKDLDQEAEAIIRMHPCRRAFTFQTAFLAGIRAEDIEEAAAALLKKAKDGDVAAARVLFDRCLGVKPVAQWRSEADVRRAESLP